MILSFKEVLSVEADLRQKIITSINTKYISALHNCNTKSINKTNDFILKHIFNTYGETTPQMLIQHDYLVKQMTFDVNTPIDTVSRNVDELGDISTVALNKYSNKQ